MTNPDFTKMREAVLASRGTPKRRTVGRLDIAKMREALMIARGKPGDTPAGPATVNVQPLTTTATKEMSA